MDIEWIQFNQGCYYLINDTYTLYKCRCVSSPRKVGSYSGPYCYTYAYRHLASWWTSFKTTVVSENMINKDNKYNNCCYHHHLWYIEHKTHAWTLEYIISIFQLLGRVNRYASGWLPATTAQREVAALT